MRLICFDTHILIWGIKKQATDGQEDKVSLAKNFIESINEEDTSVLIPSLVVAEYLMPIPPASHATVINVFNKNFIIAPFDALAASKFALVWQTNKPMEEADALIKKGVTKAELKVDSMIIATALARKAECIYSHDKGLKTIAKNFIDVREIPFIPEQTEAFPKDKGDWGKIPKEGLIYPERPI